MNKARLAKAVLSLVAAVAAASKAVQEIRLSLKEAK